jgi:hypothetical protein
VEISSDAFLQTGGEGASLVTRKRVALFATKHTTFESKRRILRMTLGCDEHGANYLWLQNWTKTAPIWHLHAAGYIQKIEHEVPGGLP